MLYFLLFGKRKLARSAWLYSVVFGGRISALTVTFLLLSFMIQPINQAYGAGEAESVPDPTPAAEVEPDTTGIEADSEPEAVASEENEIAEVEDQSDVEAVETSDVVEELSDNTDTAVPSTVRSSTTDGQSAAPSDNAVRSSTTNATNDNTSSSNNGVGSSTESAAQASTTAEHADNVSETPVAKPVEDQAVEQPTADSVESEEVESNTSADDRTTDSDSGEETEDTIESDQTTTTSPVIVREVRPVRNEQNYYQFSKQSCVSVGNGTFHCSSDNVPESDDRAVVFARMADNGNQEIFIRTRQGREERLTDNDYDDTAPQYDPASQQIVWQRKIDGRYQIVLYDIERGKESQLTFSRSNNMEPSVSESGVVWQAWDGNDWEIMYYDGNFTDQITNNQSQDIGPTIQDDYILWSVPGDNVQEAKVYSLANQEIMTVSGHEGGDIINPRFVLVYDTRYDNGDVVTQSFDPETGIAQPIAATPAQDPIDIPTPDPIGEIRALINNKTSEKNNVVKVASTTDSPNTDLHLASSSATTTDTLVITPDDIDDQFASTSAIIEDDFELTEYDLVITGDAVSTTSATSTQP